MILNAFWGWNEGAWSIKGGRHKFLRQAISAWLDGIVWSRREAQSERLVSIQFNSIQIKRCCVHSWMPHLLEFFPVKFREAVLVHLSSSCFGLRAQG